MHVHGPAPVGHAVIESAVLQNIVLRQDVIPQDPSAFPHTGQNAHPFQIEIFSTVIAAVFDVIPHTPHAGHKLIPHILIL